jgi:hypothetical protein
MCTRVVWRMMIGYTPRAQLTRTVYSMNQYIDCKLLVIQGVQSVKRALVSNWFVKILNLVENLRKIHFESILSFFMVIQVNPVSMQKTNSSL